MGSAFVVEPVRKKLTFLQQRDLDLWKWLAELIEPKSRCARCVMNIFQYLSYVLINSCFFINHACRPKIK